MVIKVGLSLLILILHSMALVYYFINPILSWIFKTESFFVSPPYHLYSEITSFLIVAVPFCIITAIISRNKFALLLYKLCLRSIWTALPGILVAIFLIGQYLAPLGYKAAGVGVIIALMTMWFVPLYVVLIAVPFQTRMFWQVLHGDTALSKRAASMVAVSLTVVPFIGVMISNYIFNLLR